MPILSKSLIRYSMLAMLVMCIETSYAHEQDPSDRNKHEQDKSVNTLQNPNDWPSYNHDNLGHRYNRAEHHLNRQSVKDLQVLWKYPTCGPVHSTPAVVDNKLYAGDMCGIVYALNSEGELLWTTQLTRFVLGSAVITKEMVIIGDMAGFVFGLDRESGAIIWSVKPNPHPYAAIWGSPIIADGKVIVGVASLESSAPVADPNYPCCSFRGSVAALNPANGEQIWQYYFVSEEEAAAGSSGVGIWSIPTYDQSSKLLFVGTGNNLSAPTTNASDGIAALNVKNGELVWQTQFTQGEYWNHTFLYDAEHQDADVGDSPKIYQLEGRTVVGAGDKTGVYYVLDAETGKILHDEKLLPAGLLAGFQTGCAYANGRVYTNGVNWPDAQSPLRLSPELIPPPTAGHVLALTGKGKELWRFTTDGSINAAGVSVAADVVYFQSLHDGFFYALDAEDGALLKRIEIGPALSGPAISRGQIYLGTGNLLFSQILPNDPLGEIIALGLKE